MKPAILLWTYVSEAIDSIYAQCIRCGHEVEMTRKYLYTLPSDQIGTVNYCVACGTKFIEKIQRIKKWKRMGLDDIYEGQPSAKYAVAHRHVITDPEFRDHEDWQIQYDSQFYSKVSFVMSNELKELRDYENSQRHRLWNTEFKLCMVRYNPKIRWYEIAKI